MSEEVKKEAQAETSAEEKKEETVAEPPKEKAPKEEKTEEKPAPSGKFKEVIEKIESLTALELADLVKELEKRFGVSAAAPVAVAFCVPI